jgi:hypothetical protein
VAAAFRKSLTWQMVLKYPANRLALIFSQNPEAVIPETILIGNPDSKI